MRVLRFLPDGGGPVYGGSRELERELGRQECADAPLGEHGPQRAVGVLARGGRHGCESYLYMYIQGLV